MKALEGIESALLEIGVLAAGESLSDAEAQDALSSLNRMIDGWGTERQTIYAVTRNVHNLVASKQTYTLGTGGDFNQVRPVWIERAGTILDKTAGNLLEPPLEILTVEEWARITVKATESTYPQRLYYDKSWAAGLGNVSLYPVPDNANGQAVLYTPTAVAEFANLSTTDYTFPPGYRDALVYKLAVRLGPMFGRTASPDTREQANEYFGRIKDANSDDSALRCDPALVGDIGSSRYNWYTDE